MFLGGRIASHEVRAYYLLGGCIAHLDGCFRTHSLRPAAPGSPLVNYHDPDVVLQDTCAYAFTAKYMGSGSQLNFFDSGSDEDLACYGWTLLVRLPRRPWPCFRTLSRLHLTGFRNVGHKFPYVRFSWFSVVARVEQPVVCNQRKLKCIFTDVVLHVWTSTHLL